MLHSSRGIVRCVFLNALRTGFTILPISPPMWVVAALERTINIKPKINEEDCPILHLAPTITKCLNAVLIATLAQLRMWFNG